MSAEKELTSDHYQTGAAFVFWTDTTGAFIPIRAINNLGQRPRCLRRIGVIREAGGLQGPPRF